MGINIFDCISICLIALTIITFSCGLLYYIIKRTEYKKIINKRIKYIEKMDISLNKKETLNELASKTYITYYSYAIHTIMFMLCNIFGLLYTIASFILSFSPEPNCMGYIISFSAIFFVVIIIYVAPQRRSTQFLKGWRRLNNELLIGMYGKLPDGSDDPDSLHILFSMNEIENSFTADEDN